MKNMKKLVALFAAAVMIMSLGVSAFAAAVDTDASGYNEEETVFNLVFTPGENEAAQLTMIAYLVPAAEYTEENPIPDYDGTQEVVAIDQVGGAAGFGTVPVDVAKLQDESKAIAVAIGGTGISTAAKYLVTYNKEQQAVVVYGDVDGNNVINATDASWILTKFANSTTVLPCGNDAAADVDGNNVINATDASWVLTKFANSTTVFPAEQK